MRWQPDCSENENDLRKIVHFGSLPLLTADSNTFKAFLLLFPHLVDCHLENVVFPKNEYQERLARRSEKCHVHLTLSDPPGCNHIKSHRRQPSDLAACTSDRSVAANPQQVPLLHPDTLAPVATIIRQMAPRALVACILAKAEFLLEEWDSQMEKFKGEDAPHFPADSQPSLTTLLRGLC